LFLNIKFPTGRIYEDEATTYKLISNSSSIFYTPEPLYIVTVRQNSITTNKVSLKNLFLFEIFIDQIDFCIKNNISIEPIMNKLNSSIIHFLNKALLSSNQKKELLYRLITFSHNHKVHLFLYTKISFTGPIIFFRIIFLFLIYKPYSIFIKSIKFLFLLIKK